VFLFEHLVDPAAQGVGVAVGAGASVGGADDFEGGDPGRGRQRVGVEGPLMGDLLAVGGFGDLEIEKIEEPGETRKPVTTSSKISTTPCCRVNSRSSVRNFGSIGSCAP
jgi:hypothetical protein